MTVEDRLDQFKRQGGFVTAAELAFIADMRKAAAQGVGYGWMQQITEWEWNATTEHGGWGPEYFGKRIEELKQENARLREACQALVKAANDALDHWDNDRDSKVGKLLSAMGGSLKGYRAELDAAHAVIEGDGS